MITRYLSLYQLIGIVVSITAISIWCFKEGGMAPFYILFVGLLFLPFAIVSVFALLDIQKHRNTIQAGIWTGIVLLLLPSNSLPFFFEWGGLIIALICTGIAFLIWTKRDDIEWQLTIFNSIGTAIVTTALISIIVGAIS
jgi:hypothetical protein